MSLIPRRLFGIALLSIQHISFSEPPNLSKLKAELVHYHDSGQYEREIRDVADHAESFIESRIHQNQLNAHPQKLALVFDVDETCLSNYSSMIQHDFTGRRSLIHRHILQAEDPVITPVLHLYQHALSQGINVFFVTGRKQSECPATQKNLFNTGYKHWTALYCRPESDHTASVTLFKALTRQAIMRQGYTIIASIGDQESDMRGGYVERGFKLPNPFYYLP